MSNMKVVSRLKLSNFFDVELKKDISEILHGNNIELNKQTLVNNVKKAVQDAYKLGVAQGKKEAEL